jgi:hypothetical protein
LKLERLEEKALKMETCLAGLETAINAMSYEINKILQNQENLTIKRHVINYNKVKIFWEAPISCHSIFGFFNFIIFPISYLGMK